MTAEITLNDCGPTPRNVAASAPDGAPLMVVARNLGDADTRMVEKHYGHLATSYVREAIPRRKAARHRRCGQGRAAHGRPIAIARRWQPATDWCAPKAVSAPQRPISDLSIG